MEETVSDDFQRAMKQGLPYRCPGGSDMRVVVQRRSDDINARSVGTVVAALLYCFLYFLLGVVADIE